MNKLPISVGILSWKSKKTLENTLNSYKINGLLDICEEVKIIFQEYSDKDIELANKFNLNHICLNDNIGIGKAFELLATTAKFPNILLLEHDWQLVENKDLTYKMLSESLDLLNKVSCVRLRHRKNYGNPLYSRVCYEGKELEFFDYNTKLYSPHLLDCVHWKNNPEIDFPNQIKKENNYFITTSRWGNWTNNPCIYKTKFYLSCIKDRTGNDIDLETNMSLWWAEQEFLVAQGEGLFEHNDIDKKDHSVVDIFPYFNEKELLELRIRMLHERVDKFIICEANRTHTGNPKEFTCKKTLEKLGLLSSKIFVLESDFSDYENKEYVWNRERMQRNCAKDLIQDGDVCFVSDCDEIINPELINYYVLVARSNPANILRIPMAFLNCRADLRACKEDGSPIIWDSPFVCLKHHLEEHTLSEIRESKSFLSDKIKYKDIFITEGDQILESGWHFSWMGDSQNRLNKYRSYVHYHDKDMPELAVSHLVESVEDQKFKQKLINDWASALYPLSQKETEEFIKDYVAKEGITMDVLGRKSIMKKYSIDFLPKEIFSSRTIKEFLLPEEKEC